MSAETVAIEEERARVAAAGALGGYWGMKVGDGLPLVEAGIVIDAYLASLTQSRRLRDYDPNEPHCPRCGININLLVDRDYLCIRCAQIGGSPAGPVTEGSTPPSPLPLTGEAPGPAGNSDDDEAGLDEDISRVESAFERLGGYWRPCSVCGRRFLPLYGGVMPEHRTTRTNTGSCDDE